MKKSALIFGLFPIFCFLSPFAAFGDIAVSVNWVRGVITVVGEGSVTSTGNKFRDEDRAINKAEKDAKNKMRDVIDEIRIDHGSSIRGRILKASVFKRRLSRLLDSPSSIIDRSVSMQGKEVMAAVTMRICLITQSTNCPASRSLFNVLDLDQAGEQERVPYDDFEVKEEEQAPSTGEKDILFDPDKPVTGLVINLRGFVGDFNEIGLLPVVVAIGGKGKSVTVYSVKVLKKGVARDVGVVKYSENVGQARQIPYLGGNVMVVTVKKIRGNGEIVISAKSARMIFNTIKTGANYLEEARVAIAMR